jgi:hypothetical protein
MTKKLAWLGIAVMTTLLALVILWQFRIAVGYFLISLALAAAARPLGEALGQTGYCLAHDNIFLFVLVLGSFGFLFVLGGGSAIRELKLFANTVAVQNEWMLPEWLGSSLRLLLAERLPSPSRLFGAFTGEQGQLVLPAILGFTRGSSRNGEWGAHHSRLEFLLERESSSFRTALAFAAPIRKTQPGPALFGKRSKRISELIFAARLS